MADRLAANLHIANFALKDATFMIGKIIHCHGLRGRRAGSQCKQREKGKKSAHGFPPEKGTLASVFRPIGARTYELSEKTCLGRHQLRPPYRHRSPNWYLVRL